ncbi:MAG: hypothetical protein AAGI38_06025 [Bacteroidota bacterium]
MSKISQIFLLTLIGGLALLLNSCKTDPNSDIADVQIAWNLVRLDQKMLAAAKEIQQSPDSNYFEAYQHHLADEREFLFYFTGLEMVEAQRGPIPENLIDTLIALKFGPVLADSLLLALLDTVQQVFPTDAAIESAITPLLKRVHLHFPDLELPEIRTHVNGYTPAMRLDQVDQTFAAPGYLSLGLHYYLGPDYRYLSPTLPGYLRKRFSPAYMECNMAHEFAFGLVPTGLLPPRASLIEKMVHAGIRQEVVDELLPNTPDSMKLFYTTSAMEWAEVHEKNVFIELSPDLYGKGYVLHRDYLGEAPFTRRISRESAPRLGMFTGWKIVEAFRERNPDIRLDSLIRITDYEGVFKRSGYKP